MNLRLEEESKAEMDISCIHPQNVYKLGDSTTEPLTFDLTLNLILRHIDGHRSLAEIISISGTHIELAKMAIAKLLYTKNFYQIPNVL